MLLFTVSLGNKHEPPVKWLANFDCRWWMCLHREPLGRQPTIIWILFYILKIQSGGGIAAGTRELWRPPDRKREASCMWRRHLLLLPFILSCQLEQFKDRSEGSCASWAGRETSRWGERAGFDSSFSLSERLNCRDACLYCPTPTGTKAFRWSLLCLSWLLCHVIFWLSCALVLKLKKIILHYQSPELSFFSQHISLMLPLSDC